MFINTTVSFAQSTDSPQTITVDGKLYEAGSTTEALEDASVVMRVQVLNPAKSCILYEEQHTFSTLATSGHFNIQVGSAVGDPKRTALDSANNMTTVFFNRTTAITGKTSGGGGCAYTPTTEDVRHFRFFVTPSTVGTTSQLTPDMRVDSVPQALVAQTLQGLGKDDVFHTSVTSTQARLDNLLTTNYSNITDLIGGTSSMYLRNASTGTLLPTRPNDPSSPAAGQLWYDTTANQIKYYDGTAVQSVGAAGAGITSLTAGTGLDGGTITTTGTISIATGGVTNAMLATGIDASKITAGTLPAGVVPTNTDTTKLPLAGGTMTGAITMGAATTFGGFDLLGTGHITMNSQKTITVGRYTGAQETTLISTLTGANAGATWYNSTTNKLMYWNGTSAFELAETTSAGGDITAVNTNAGSGLTGGATSGPITLAINVDNNTIEISTNTVQVKDAGITNAKLANDAVTSAKILDGEIVNADISATAAIAWTKIDKTGATAADVGAVPTSRTISTNAGSGLTGGGDLTANRALALNVDNSTVEIATNTVQVKDGGITNAKIATMNITKLTQGAGDYFAYMPAGTECATGEVLKWNAASDRWLCDTDVGVSAHSALSGLTAGDDHTQYVMLAGRAGGQTIYGGTASGNNFTLESTSHATKGHVILQPTTGNVGIGTTNPGMPLEVAGAIQGSSVSASGGPLTSSGSNNSSYASSSGAIAHPMSGASTAARLTLSNQIAGDNRGPYFLMTARNTSGNTQSAYIGSYATTGAGVYTPYIVIGQQTGSTSYEERLRVDQAGNVGIGTTSPAARLDVEGTVQVGDGGETCTIAANAGMIKYAAGSLQYCNGSAWQTLGVSGSGLTTLNGQTGSTQTFAVNAIGTAPAINSATDTHTLSIPLASGVGVTSGTISKTDYDSFVAKLSAVTGSTLNSARFWVGDAGNQAAAVLMSGDATLSNTGALTIAADAVTTGKIADGTITNADINAAAAIAWTKIDKTGAVASDVGAVPTARTISTNAGSGLTGGGDLTADRALALNVDNSTIEIATNTVQVKDGGITNAKIATMNITKLTQGAGDYFAYMPAGTECNTGEVLKWNAASDRWLCDTDATGSSDHGALSGLGDDDHTQYVLLAGRSGGQLLYGGTASGDDLTIESTSHATKGDLILQLNGGRVGIGTATPLARLSIAGTMNDFASSGIAFGDGDTGFYETADDALAFRTQGTNRIFYSSTGDIMSNTGHGYEIDNQNTVTFAPQSGDSDTGMGGPAVDTVAFYTAGSERVRIDSAGDFGIGTNNPVDPLHINHTTPAIRLQDSDHNNYATIGIGGPQGSLTIEADAGNTATSTRMYFNTKGTNRLTIDNDGTVGIGTTSPAANLNIAVASGSNTLFLDAYGTGATGQVSGRAARGTQSAPTATLANDNIFFSGGRGYTGSAFATASSAGMYVIAGQNFSAANQGGYITFETTPLNATAAAGRVERVRIDVNGNMGIGTTAPAAKLDIEGTVQIGDGGEACTIAANAGMIKYASGSLQYCNGSAWQTLGVSGSGLTTLNGQTGSTQTFAVDASGTAPAINSAANTHTLSIPLASGVGVTSGTISKTDYDSFVAKLTAVTGSTLNSARIWVGDAGNQAAAVLMSGDATLSNTGVLTIATDAVTTTKIIDGAVTNAKIATMNITKLTNGPGDYFAYMPAGTECNTGEVLKWNAASDRWLCDTDVTGGDHGALTGLGDDDHTQYVLLAGRSGGQVLRGGTASGDDLTLESTSHATKGDLILQPSGGRTTLGSSTTNNSLFTIYTEDTGSAAQGLVLSDAVNELGSWQNPSGIDGLTVDTSGAPNGWGKFFINFYSTGDVSLVNGGGRVGVGGAAAATPHANLDVSSVTTPVSSGAITMTAALNSPAITTSGSIALRAGDVLVPTTTSSVRRVVMNTATGTSFTATSNFSANITAETFSIYRPSFVAGTDGLTTLKVLGQTSGVVIREPTTASLIVSNSVPTSNPNSEIVLKNYRSAYGAGNPRIVSYVSRGVEGTPSAVTNGMTLLSLQGRGYASTGVWSEAVGGQIEFVATGNWANSVTTTDMTFSTSNPTMSEKMRILGNGNVGIGTTAPLSILDINGAQTIREIASGSAPTPTAGRTFIYADNSAHTLKISNNGAAYVDLLTTSSGTPIVNANNGTAAAPSIAFSADTDTGFYSAGADTIGITVGGTQRFQATTTTLGSVTTGGGQVTSGTTAGAPGLSFFGDADTGWFRAAADTMAASTAGTERMRIDSSGNVGIGTTVATAKTHIKHVQGSGTLVPGVMVESSLENATAANNLIGVKSTVERKSSTTGNTQTLAGATFDAWNYSGSGTVSDGYGIKVYYDNDNAGTTTNAYGIHVDMEHNTGTSTNLYGGYFNIYAYGTATNAYGVRSALDNSTAITNAYGLHISQIQSGGTTGTGYGVYIDDIEATNQWGIYQVGASDKNYFSGSVGIGTTNPAGILDVRGGTAAASTSGTHINIVSQAGGTGGAAGGNIYLTPGAGTSAWPSGQVLISANSNRAVVGIGRNNTDSYATSSGATDGPIYTMTFGNGFYASGNTTLLGFDMGNGSNGQKGYFGAVTTAGAGNYSPAFVWGQQTGATAYSERMRLNENGYLGIGTTTPTSLLDVVSSSTATSGTEYGSTSLRTLNPASASTSTQYGRYDELIYSSASDWTVGSTSSNAASYSHFRVTGAANLNNANAIYARVNNSSTGTITTARGVYGDANPSSGTITEANGVFGRALANSTGSATITGGNGVYAIATQASSGANTISTARGLFARVTNTSTDVGGVITTAKGGDFSVTNSGSGSIGTSYGVYIGTVEGTTNYGLYQALSTNKNYLAGYLGLGTSSPTTKLTLLTSTTPATTYTSDMSATGYPTGEAVVVHRSSANFDDQYVGSAFQVVNTAGTVQRAYVGALSTAATGNRAPIVFGQSSSGSAFLERMRIETTGNVGIGTTVPNDLLDVGTGSIRTGGDGTSGDSKRISTDVINSSRSTTAALSHMVFYNPNGQVGSISTSGTTTAYNTTSDVRLKENFRNIENATDKIRQIKVQSYNYILDPSKQRLDGFLAQQVQTIVPYAVTIPQDEYDENGKLNPWYVDYSKFIPLLTASVQELDQKTVQNSRDIASLKTDNMNKDKKIHELEKQNADQAQELKELKSRLDRIEKLLQNR